MLATQTPGQNLSAFVDAHADGAGVACTANTNLNATQNATVNIGSSVTLSGPASLQIGANTGAPSYSSHAIADGGAIAAYLDPTATNTVSSQASVVVGAGSTATTSQLVVSALNASPTMTTKADQDASTLIVLGGSSHTQTLTNSDSINYNANTTITGGAQLVINSGGAITNEAGVSASFNGSVYNVGAISNPGAGSATLNASGGGTNLGVTGNATFTYLAGVNVSNQSNHGLVFAGIDLSKLNTQTNLSVSPSQPSTFTVVKPTSDTVINITQIGQADITLNGAILNPIGATTITNQAGNISAGGGESMQTGSASLSATGSIGTSSSRVNIQLVQATTQAASLTTSAGQNLYLNLSELNQTSGAASVSGSTQAGSGYVDDLRVQDAQQQQTQTSNGQTTTTIVPQPSSYTVTVSPAPGNTSDPTLNIDAGNASNAPIALSVMSTASLPVGVVSSRYGNVSLQSTAGAITAATGNTNVNGNNVTLNAAASISLTIDAGYSGAGNLNASAGGNISLAQSRGNLSLGEVQSIGGDISLTSAGQILNGGATTNIAGSEQVALSATGLGASASRLQINAPYLEAAAGGGSIWLNSQANLTIGRRQLLLARWWAWLAGGSIDITGAGSALYRRRERNGPGSAGVCR